MNSDLSMAEFHACLSSDQMDGSLLEALRQLKTIEDPQTVVNAAIEPTLATWW